MSDGASQDHCIERHDRAIQEDRPGEAGQLELSAEGEEALRLYIKKYENLLGGLCPPERDPLAKICGIGRSSARHNVLKDLEKLETGEL